MESLVDWPYAQLRLLQSTNIGAQLLLSPTQPGKEGTQAAEPSNHPSFFSG